MKIPINNLLSTLGLEDLELKTKEDIEDLKARLDVLLSELEAEENTEKEEIK